MMTSRQRPQEFTGPKSMWNEDKNSFRIKLVQRDGRSFFTYLEEPPVPDFFVWDFIGQRDRERETSKDVPSLFTNLG